MKSTEVSHILPTQAGTIHLEYPTKKSAYDAYTSECRSSGCQPTSYETFRTAWKTPGVSHIKTERKTGTLSVCQKCKLFKMKLRKISPHCEDEREKLIQQYEGHRLWALLEKTKYYERRNCGIFQKSNFLSIIVDGATQRVHSIPRFGFFAKNTVQEFLPQSVLAILAHGHATFLYPRVPWVPGGSSFTIQCLSYALETLSKSETYKDNGLPPDLFLQMDNCSGENKNKYVFGWGATLVEDGVFETISFSFLLVGHTHEDIDALHSRISRHLAKKPIFSLQEFDELLESALKSKKSRKDHLTMPAETKVFVKRFNGTADFKRLLDPCVDDKLNGLKVPLCFLVYADADEFGNRVARVKYRASWVSEDWFPRGAAGETMHIQDHYSKQSSIPTEDDLVNNDSNFSKNDSVLLRVIEKDALQYETCVGSRRKTKIISAHNDDENEEPNTKKRKGVTTGLKELKHLPSANGVFSLFSPRSLQNFTEAHGMQWTNSHARLEDVSWQCPHQFTDRLNFNVSLDKFLKSDSLKIVCSDSQRFQKVLNSWKSLIIPAEVDEINETFDIDWESMRRFSKNKKELVTFTETQHLLALNPDFNLNNQAEMVFGNRTSIVAKVRIIEELKRSTKTRALKRGDFVIALRDQSTNNISGSICEGMIVISQFITNCTFI